MDESTSKGYPNKKMTYDQRRLIRRSRKGGRPSTALGIGERSFWIIKG
jgi:hypothetical protein